jgi:hypothetical protein
MALAELGVGEINGLAVGEDVRAQGRGDGSGEGDLAGIVIVETSVYRLTQAGPTIPCELS